MKQAGFTLIEVVLILVIVGVAILPLSLLFANASIRSGEARDATTAAQLAQADDLGLRGRLFGLGNLFLRVGARRRDFPICGV